MGRCAKSPISNVHRTLTYYDHLESEPRTPLESVHYVQGSWNLGRTFMVDLR